MSGLVELRQALGNVVAGVIMSLRLGVSTGQPVIPESGVKMHR
jgi:hypothetical protein